MNDFVVHMTLAGCALFLIGAALFLWWLRSYHARK